MESGIVAESGCACLEEGVGEHLVDGDSIQEQPSVAQIFLSCQLVNVDSSIDEGVLRYEQDQVV